MEYQTLNLSKCADCSTDTKMDRNKQKRKKEKKTQKIVCHISRVRCHVSHVPCHRSPVACHLQLTPIDKINRFFSPLHRQTNKNILKIFTKLGYITKPVLIVTGNDLWLQL